MAESARVVISTVGPYVSYGEPLVAAGANAGTDYVDLTGDPSSSTCATSATTSARSRRARGSCTAVVSTRCRTTSARTSPRSSYPRRAASRARIRARLGGVLGWHVRVGTQRVLRARANLSASKERRRLEPRPVDRRLARQPVACTATPTRRPGRFRCRPSTARSSGARRGRWNATARTSRIRTTPPSSGCPSR